MSTSSLKTRACLFVSLVCTLSAFVSRASASTCSAGDKPSVVTHDYTKAFNPGVLFNELPGFTRSVYYQDHALITPESRVFAANPLWKKAVTAHLISPASGAFFSMYLADCQAGAEALPPAPGVERFVLVLQGEAELSTGGKVVPLKANHYAYFPPNETSTLSSAKGAGLLVYERVYAAKGKPVLQHGHTEDSPLLPCAGEVFDLRKLLPATADYDVNFHVMDFKPGQYLFVKEIHYNQHGLLMLEGQGIYRLADKWYPVQAGDAIYMAPYVTQWYGALGDTPSRYIILKDTTLDPLAT